MNGYPREIQIQKVRYDELPNGFEYGISVNQKLNRNISSNSYFSERSYHEINREYSGVNIRSSIAENNKFSFIPNGQIRPAISNIEGLERYTSKNKLETCSHQNVDQKYYNDDTSLPESTVLKINCALENAQISVNNNNCNYNYTNQKGSTNNVKLGHKLDPSVKSDVWTKFDQICQEFNRRNKHAMRNGKRLGFYQYILDIGRGNFSKVKLALHSLLDIEVAIKVIDRTKFDEKTRRLLSQELLNMERLDHPHIIRIYEAHEVVQCWHLVMEYAPKGELNSFLKRYGKMEEKNVRLYSSQILSALEHLHMKNVVHRDLKAENVFIVSNQCVKVGDFGFSKCIQLDTPLTTFCGSPPYAAPELFISDSYIGTQVDLWALGVLIFYMVTGELPFKSVNLHKIKRLVLNCDYQIPLFVSSSCHTLIRGLINDSVNLRYNISQVKSSPFFSETNWSLIEYPLLISNDGLDHKSTCSLLKQWWNIDEWELERALKQGPKQKLTGIYRILRDKGTKFQDHPSQPILKKKCVRHKRSIKVDSNTRNKSTLNLKAQPVKELTTVDLRDTKSMKNKSLSNDATTTRTCTIL